jgi:hypothetical protein
LVRASMADIRNRILFATGSRGSGISQFLDGQQLDCHITTIVRGGVKLQELLDIVQRRRTHFDLFIVCGGICNFTEKRRSGSNICLHYEPEDGLVDTITDLIRSLKTDLGSRLNVATIPPAHLENSNLWKNGPGLTIITTSQGSRNCYLSTSTR